MVSLSLLLAHLCEQLHGLACALRCCRTNCGSRTMEQAPIHSDFVAVGAVAAAKQTARCFVLQMHIQTDPLC
jgi:hypothetical protein